MQFKPISLKLILLSCTFGASLMLLSSAVAAGMGGVFVGDQTLDKIYLTKDLNGDGDANDPGEVSVYFGMPLSYPPTERVDWGFGIRD